MKKVKIIGRNNTISIGDFSVLKDVSICILGDNNNIVIGNWCRLKNTELHIEDSGNLIQIGKETKIFGKTHLAAIEGTKIKIGSDCMFANHVHFRTGDSHSILDMDDRRINRSEDITVGDHVWFGINTICLKGSEIPNNSIVGACSLVTGKFKKSNCVIAGVPAKVVKNNVDWAMKRVPVGEIAESKV